ncbi:hypothetical protein CAOG_07828 [Capsaspora owczarzaki ATCC 30864]|uniref:Uncharacterized protein n=1 Tax=Capsaspora owczarzaki (strain ATCC 30864) TaxID=595528 RepID=A0A0D2WY02_CAPO3|nr:hypothetical protein CAOG_07828 [Capsaspora owczarzaki ATCC 30864]KJE97723.1 hypothetical protein CAOG_007828 [Capsaspora owczarzaki ATCC 30864]|eukprot:XP_004342901.1 hypothetical protein CAOG_07828 [Capsaspora owczarzaki ATCC 30864]
MDSERLAAIQHELDGKEAVVASLEETNAALQGRYNACLQQHNMLQGDCEQRRKAITDLEHQRAADKTALYAARSRYKEQMKRLIDQQRQQKARQFDPSLLVAASAAVQADILSVEAPYKEIVEQRARFDHSLQPISLEAMEPKSQTLAIILRHLQKI